MTARSRLLVPGVPSRRFTLTVPDITNKSWEERVRAQVTRVSRAAEETDDIAFVDSFGVAAED